MIERYIKEKPRKGIVIAQMVRRDYGTKFSVRDVKRHVHKKREQGYAICSGKDGYYIATETADLNRFVSMMMKQAISRLEIVRGVQRRWRLKKDPEQIRLLNEAVG